MITIKARFDGRVFVPEEPVNLPAGQVLELVISSPDEQRTPLMDLIEIAKQFPSDPDSPTDRAAQHDHYLYGTPKRP
jgi:hypothetical protein